MAVRSMKLCQKAVEKQGCSTETCCSHVTVCRLINRSMTGRTWDDNNRRTPTPRGSPVRKVNRRQTQPAEHTGSESEEECEYVSSLRRNSGENSALNPAATPFVPDLEVETEPLEQEASGALQETVDLDIP